VIRYAGSTYNIVGGGLGRLGRIIALRTAVVSKYNVKWDIKKAYFEDL
jgi:hypothetical protein